MKRPRNRGHIIAVCRWLPWGEDVPPGWVECQPLGHHAIYGRLIVRRVGA